MILATVSGVYVLRAAGRDHARPHRHDLRRAELAAYIGISPTGLANILNSHSEPTLRTAGKMAAAFGISLDELYGDLTRCVRAASVAFETAPVRSVRKGRRVFD